MNKVGGLYAGLTPDMIKLDQQGKNYYYNRKSSISQPHELADPDSPEEVLGGIKGFPPVFSLERAAAIAAAVEGCD
jgi:hypothetical protein